MDERQVTAAHYEREIIKRVEERNDQLSRTKLTSPPRRGTTVKFRRYDPFPPSVQPFTEGKRYPEFIELKYHDVEITREEYEKLKKERTI
jgi:hypothetical protein